MSAYQPYSEQPTSRLEVLAQQKLLRIQFLNSLQQNVEGSVLKKHIP